MASAGKKIIEGLKESVRYARCQNRHVESHVTTKTGEHEFTVECQKCGLSWVIEDRDEGFQVIRHL